MPDKTECPTCGEKMDPRGLPGHQRIKHGDSGSDEMVTVDRGELGLDAEEVEALPAVEADEDSITLRRVDLREIVVTDEELKQELGEELKKFIQSGELRV